MKTIRLTSLILVTVIALGIGTARAGQPHMQAALDHLRAARAELKAAEHNKGSWRVRALNYVDSASSDTEAGIHAGR